VGFSLPLYWLLEHGLLPRSACPEQALELRGWQLDRLTGHGLKIVFGAEFANLSVPFGVLFGAVAAKEKGSDIHLASPPGAVATPPGIQLLNDPLTIAIHDAARVCSRRA
jgi:hypothetical protein